MGVHRGIDLLSPSESPVTPHTPLYPLRFSGSGKTNVIVNRLLFLCRVAGVPPKRMLAVSFTNKVRAL